MFGRMNIYVYDCRDGPVFWEEKSPSPSDWRIGEIFMVDMVGWRQPNHHETSKNRI